ncbi:hypothetical protein NE237_020867 [Protea cynaroides]|uniref:Uncharacterized protein n=1 Tax=Protea cynaroides TaxID=273540 RepID=A0A9Q0HBE0_9MAGN|nr:hypothetical protein NE237_020867 [Protea cynaroides]
MAYGFIGAGSLMSGVVGGFAVGEMECGSMKEARQVRERWQQQISGGVSELSTRGLATGRRVCVFEVREKLDVKWRHGKVGSEHQGMGARWSAVVKRDGRWIKGVWEVECCRCRWRG